MTVNELIQIVGRYGEAKDAGGGLMTYQGGKWEIVGGIVKRYDYTEHVLLEVTEAEVVEAMESVDTGSFTVVPAYNVYHNGMFVAVGWDLVEDNENDPLADAKSLFGL